MKCKLGDIATITMGQSPKGDTYNNNGNGMLFYRAIALLEIGIQRLIRGLLLPQRSQKHAMLS